MKRVISAILAFISFVALWANDDDDTRARIFADMNDYIQAQQFDRAKEVYLSNAELLKDNGEYECFAAYLYGCLLARDGNYNDAVEALSTSIRILDENYEDVVKLHSVNFVAPYYQYFIFATYTDRKNTEELLRKAKNAFEDAGLTDNSQYLQICEELTDRESAEDVGRLNAVIQNLSTEVKQRKYSSVMPKVEKCLSILDNMPNPPAKMYGILYQLKGRMAWYTGDMNMAEDSYLRALKAIDALIPNDNDCQDLALKLYTDLAAVYGAVKDYKNCASLLQICKNYYETEGKLGYEYARTLGNLAIASIGLGNRLQATMLLETAIDILSGIENVNPIEIATIYSSASVCYGDMGNETEALDAALKAKEYIHGDAFPGIIAQVENNIGCLYMAQGNLVEAQKAFERATEFVGHDPLSSQVRFNLACSMYLKGDSNLNQTVTTNSKILQDEVLSSFLFLFEQQRLNYWDATGGLLDGYNRFLFDLSNNQATGTIYDNALFAKGLLLRTSNWLSSAIVNNADSASRETLNTISAYQSRISSGELSADSIGYYEGLIANLEKELLRDNVTYRDLKNNLTTSWRDIKESLKKGEVAIEFIKLPIIRDNAFTAQNEFSAIVLRPDMKVPEIVSLFDDSALDSLLVMPEQLSRINDETKRNELYRGYLYGTGQIDYRIGTKRQHIMAVGDSLYSLIWNRLTPLLKGCTTVYYSPTSTLNSISFAALNDGAETLGEKYSLHLLSSTAEIITAKKEERLPQNSVVYGGIRYDADSEDLIAQARCYNHTDEADSRGIMLNESERGSWGFLKGTLQEATNVTSQLSALGISSKMLSDVVANEESFKNLDGQSPAMLHIATHGFFLTNPKDIETNAFLTNANARSTNVGQVLNRSGLLFAGANRSWSGQGAIPGIDDGILTANEISNLNLSTTDIVVLSACETGLGVDGASEGVFGLQRAFKLAGVKTLIMSLWKVPDAQTSELMQTFYSNWLGGMNRHAAFAAAQRKIKETNPNPYYWAGFVMLD